MSNHAIKKIEIPVLKFVRNVDSHLGLNVEETLIKSRRILEQSKSLTLLNSQKRIFFDKEKRLFESKTVEKDIYNASIFRTISNASNETFSSIRKDRLITPSALGSYPSFNDKRNSSLDSKDSQSPIKTFDNGVNVTSSKRNLRTVKWNNLRNESHCKVITSEFNKLKLLYDELNAVKIDLERRLQAKEKLNSYERNTSDPYIADLENRLVELEGKYNYEIALNERLKDEIRYYTKNTNYVKKLSSSDYLSKINDIEDKLIESCCKIKDLRKRINFNENSSSKDNHRIKKNPKSILGKNLCKKPKSKIIKKLTNTFKTKQNFKK